MLYGHSHCRRAQGCIAMDGPSCLAPPITSVMNGRQVEHLLWTSVGLLVVENMHFWTNVCLLFFFSGCDMYYHLSQYWSLLFLATMKKCTELRKYVFPDPCLSPSYSSSFPSDLQCRGCRYPLHPVFHISSHPLRLSFSVFLALYSILSIYTFLTLPVPLLPSVLVSIICLGFPMLLDFFVLFWWILPPLKIFDTFLTLCIVMKRKKCVAFRHTVLFISSRTNKMTENM